MQVYARATAESTTLKQAILMYGDFATVHEVDSDGANPVIRPGVLATREGLAAALRALVPPSAWGTAILPESMLTAGDDHMVWWIKPTRRKVWFKCAELGGEVSATVPHPGLVMAVVGGHWYVWAVNGNKRPDAQTELYQAPYFNVWKSGEICVGSARTPTAEHRMAPTAWENAFFESAFSHPNVHAPELLVKKGSVFAFWRDMLAGKYVRFPSSMLVNRSVSLGEVINQLTRG